ncbi:head completion/stabilization protein [Sphingomonas psychrotolerans]|uniref:Head completion/stabilization protein n=1 Tax=Sphingomonas psychrotolerans TaxID=1327635 RepID=A0ABU3N112_9SPHN|nr:head completion/stabilization protein [Sphingomonas psychrotolerans]MDT8758230.1 head completion/stabilization protein [Sphingomonas psychrotolerans]
MNGLITTPAAAPDPANAEVVADGWFPPVKLAAVRDTLRIGEGVVTTPRLVAAIEGAMLHAFRELADWRASHATAGVAQLADVTAFQLNGRNMAVVLWERVVRYFAGAEITGQHRDISATTPALDREQDQDGSADELRRLALAAVADLRSIGGTPVPRNRVELI